MVISPDIDKCPLRPPSEDAKRGLCHEVTTSFTASMAVNTLSKIAANSSAIAQISKPI
jgi:hypothetical protein